MPSRFRKYDIVSSAMSGPAAFAVPPQRHGFLRREYENLRACGTHVTYVQVVVAFLVYCIVWFGIGWFVLGPAYSGFPAAPSSAALVTAMAERPGDMATQQLVALEARRLASEAVESDIRSSASVQSTFSGLVQSLADAAMRTSGSTARTSVAGLLQSSATAQAAGDALNVAVASAAKLNAQGWPAGFADSPSGGVLPDTASVLNACEDNKTINVTGLVGTDGTPLTSTARGAVESSWYNAYLSQLESSLQYNLAEQGDVNAMLALGNPIGQRSWFLLAFGLIATAIGSLLYMAFVQTSLTSMAERRFRIQLASWLQVFTNAVQAGETIEQALVFSLTRVEGEPLRSVVQEMSARYATHKDLSHATEPLAAWGSVVPEIRNIMAALSVQDQKGGDLAPVMFSIMSVMSVRRLVQQKVESVASEATGQLRIIFVMFFGIILIQELFMKSFEGSFSPTYVFFQHGGGLGGMLYLFAYHLVVFAVSFVLWRSGGAMVSRELKY
ncbi:MAG: type II secretion system F family protein [Caldiserica bacterium]|nr:type II secretion system F family protein [Caldisericota bacterium]